MNQSLKLTIWIALFLSGNKGLINDRFKEILDT